MRNLFHTALVVILIIAGCSKQEEKKKAPPSQDLEWGRYYGYYHNDSAFYFYKRVIDNSHDSVEKGEAYFYMGLQLLEVGDYYSAQESFLSSIKTLDEKDTAHYRIIEADYNSLANATLELGEYESAIQYYYLASEFTSGGDRRLQVLNNLGVVYQKKRDYKKAIAAFDSANVHATDDTILKARIISNFARTKWLVDSNYNALPEFMTALELRRLVKFSLGMSTSFAHLSDYYKNTRPDSAFYYALKRFEIVQTLPNPSDKADALKQLIKVSPPIQAKKYTDQYLELNDSITTARIRDGKQYILIKSDIEKSKADNVLLKKHIGKQRQLIWATALVAVLFILALIIRSRIKRKRLKQESEKVLRETKLKTSQKVHDVVANSLYRIMNELEHRETIDKEPLLNKIEELYEKSRDISYEDMPLNNEEYAQQIQHLLISFANDHTMVGTVGNQQPFWNKVTAFQKQELQLVLEEMMVNMQKHSRAKNVSIQFRQENGIGHINYKDDGIGFPSGLEFGNGLNNTVNRIESIKGQITFGKSGEKGASISISFPLELHAL